MACLLLAAVSVAASAGSAGSTASASASASVRADGDSADAAMMLEGVGGIATGGNPATLVAWGDAQPLSVADDGRIFAAASTLGRGRVVALGHGGYLGHRGGETPRFIANAVSWLAPRAAADRPLRVLGDPGAPAAAILQEAGRELQITSADRLGEADFAAFDIAIISPQAAHGAGRLDELARWVRQGGGLLAVETAWGQLQLGRAASVHELAANRLLQDAGIAYTAVAASPVRDGLYPGRPADAAAESRRRSANAEAALEILAGRAEGEVGFAARVVRDALGVVPIDGPLVASVDRLAGRAEQRAALDAAWSAMRKGPIRPAEHPLACVLIDLDARRAADAPPARVRPHPTAEAFPGPVAAGARPVRRRLELDTATPGWRSTGLWALPGEPVTVLFDAEVDEAALAAAGLTVQIGVWRDPQNFPERVRLPQAIRRDPVLGRRVHSASAIGGPVLIDLPRGLAETLGRASITVDIRGAVPMPRFRLGETDLEQWRDEIRHHPAPWAELASDHLEFSVPADVVRTLDRPDLVMEHWDRVHTAMQRLEPRSPSHWPDRPYRYVADRRLSWGYMYCPANDPIVIPMSAADEMVDLEQFDADGPHQLWGHYHEMGHAHQNSMWTFGGTGEVTVNIFTVLALTTVNGYPMDSPATRSDPATAWRRFTEHQAAGSPFDRWKSEPFLALQTYAMLWHAFGWDAFERAFRRYDELAPSERPRTDAEKRDQWLIAMSRTVGHDLGPYFQAWGVPVSEAARAAVADLPGWMPTAPASDVEGGA